MYDVLADKHNVQKVIRHVSLNCVDLLPSLWTLPPSTCPVPFDRIATPSGYCTFMSFDHHFSFSLV